MIKDRPAPSSTRTSIALRFRFRDGSPNRLTNEEHRWPLYRDQELIKCAKLTEHSPETDTVAVRPGFVDPGKRLRANGDRLVATSASVVAKNSWIPGSCGYEVFPSIFVALFLAP
jgi:hypothetical protein